MSRSVVIYTVISNDYDNIKPVVLKSIPHYLFTDNPNINAPGWNVIEIEKTEDQRLQRKIKILGHPVLDKYDVTVYVDGTMTIKNTMLNLLRTFKKGMIIGKHESRNCVYAEGLAVKEAKKAPTEVVNKQIADYYENDFPINFGMWSAGLLIRDKSTKEMCEIWYSKLEQHSHRDQLSLPWALWKTGIKPLEVRLIQYVQMDKHKKKEPPKVYYSTPWRSDKNIGKANNDFISLLPDDAWVVIMDGDALWLRPDWGLCIEKVIMNAPDEYGLIGCVTNRLGGLHQCYENRFSTDMDMFNHYEIANKLWEEEGTRIDPTSGVAGVCMIFKKEIWRKAGGFKENTITADTDFNKSVIRLGYKIGLAKGLYMMHSYRVWEREHKAAHHSIKHLK